MKRTTIWGFFCITALVTFAAWAPNVLAYTNHSSCRSCHSITYDNARHASHRGYTADLGVSCDICHSNNQVANSCAVCHDAVPLQTRHVENYGQSCNDCHDLPPTPTTTLPPTPTTTLPPTPTTTLPSGTPSTTLPTSTTTTTLPSEDLCPDDPNKTEPGVCGCGISDVDSDSDTIEDCIDNAPYNPNADQTDSDGDGVGDVAETDDTVNDPSVASLLVNYGQDRVTISTNNLLEDVYTLATDQVADLPSGVTFPFDLLGFAVTEFGAGILTTVTITLPDGEAPTTYWKYGTTPLDGTDHWYEFLYDGTTGAELDGNVITLHFVDGERGDHDLTADGIIDDPGGAAFVSTGGGGSSSNCFIATAAYGSYMEPHVMTLRQFRDSYLLTNKLGTKFVQAYYRFSPPIAEHIAEHDNLRSVTRIGIAPLVGFSWLAIHYGMTTALLFLTGIITLCVSITCLVLKTTRS